MLKYEVLPEKFVARKPQKNKVSLYKYNKVSKHTTVNGKGCVGRLIKEK